MSEQDPAADFFDLKMLPSWVKEAPDENRYADFAGDEGPGPAGRDWRGGGERRERRPRAPRKDQPRRERRGPERRPDRAAASEQPREARAPAWPPPPAVDVRFLPDRRALENVLAQIKAGHLAYSVFALARMFLEKPERYDVQLKAQSGPLFQMGEKGPVASDRRWLENGAFSRELENYYRVEVTQSEPIKGNFSSVARDRQSGTLLGPTNHHAYQAKLRTLYEQRYSRRMSFPDFQRQIEIVNDPETVERWKEEARSVTTYTTTREEPPLTFQNASEAERHFRQNYLPALSRESAEPALDGLISRQLPDRSLGWVIEEAWAREFRSPTRMMQELISAFPEAGLHIFRQRKGMLFVSPVRPRPFRHDSIGVSPSIAALLRVLAEAPGMKRKELLAKMLPAGPPESASPDLEKKKLALASDLRWLISEGHVIEFNDGSLDLSRSKSPTPPPKSVALAARTETAASPAARLEAASNHASAPEAAAPNELVAPEEPAAPNDAAPGAENGVSGDSTAS